MRVTVTDALGDTGTLSELAQLGTGQTRLYYGVGSLVATANNCPMNTVLQLGLFLARYAPGSVAAGVPAVESLGFNLDIKLPFQKGVYLSFADGTPLVDHPRPAWFPSTLECSYSEYLGEWMGGYWYFGGAWTTTRAQSSRPTTVASTR